MTDGIVTFDSESDHPRINPEFHGRSPKELSLRQIVCGADNTYPLLILSPGFRHRHQQYATECEHEFASRATARIARKAGPRLIAVALAC
jgi:hypothetical protein